MADDYSRSLACLIEGESPSFIIESEGSIDIMELTDKKEGKNGVLGSVDATNLTFWKARMIVDQQQHNQLSCMLISKPRPKLN